MRKIRQSECKHYAGKKFHDELNIDLHCERTGEEKDTADEKSLYKN